MVNTYKKYIFFFHGLAMCRWLQISHWILLLLFFPTAELLLLCDRGWLDHQFVLIKKKILNKKLINYLNNPTAELLLLRHHRRRDHPLPVGHQAGPVTVHLPARPSFGVFAGPCWNIQVRSIFAHRSNICCPRDWRLSA